MVSVLSQIIRTHQAAVSLRNASEGQIKRVLITLSKELVAHTAQLFRANAKDLALQDADNPKNDRLLLNAQRINGIAKSIRTIASLSDPSGKLLATRVLKNGLKLEKMSVPLGVVGAVYESRPNVTFDIAALCLRSRNTCVLKGSNDADNTNRYALNLIRKAIRAEGLNPNVVTLLPPAREVVTEMFAATRYIDVLIPRGSDGLIQFVRKNSQVPVIETGAGVCHVYVQGKADIGKAVPIVLNAKISRPSVCNAVDTVLVDRSVAEKFLTALQPGFIEAGVEVYADTAAYKILRGFPHLHKAALADFGREFLSLACAVKVVDGIDEALDHIAKYSTRHSEAIVSEDKKICERFIREVDAAAVYSNASTRFTDGEEFGLGAEIGISTQKLHARGPFALEKLVTEKWILRGNGQVR